MIIELRPSNTIPTTIEEAVDDIIRSCSNEDLEYARNNPSESIHFSYGMGMRNNWGLWQKDTPIKKDAIQKYGIAHADDLSGLILEWAFSKIRNSLFDPVAHCKKYHEHWARYGLSLKDFV